MLTLRSLTKLYGENTAVDALSLEVAPGKITGFLGPNGAGKSTTMRMILGLTGEYATGSITATLQCVPDRVRLLIAKSLTVGAVAFGAGIVLAVLGVVAGAVAMDASTYDFAQVAGQVFAIAVHLMLMSVLTVGLAVIVRSSAGAITVLFVLLLIVPTILPSIPLDFLTNLAQFLPQAVGTQFLTGDADLYGPATGLLLLTAWTAASLTLATVILGRRDA